MVICNDKFEGGIAFRMDVLVSEAYAYMLCTMQFLELARRLAVLRSCALPCPLGFAGGMSMSVPTVASVHTSLILSPEDPLMTPYLVLQRSALAGEPLLRLRIYHDQAREFNHRHHLHCSGR